MKCYDTGIFGELIKKWAYIKHQIPLHKHMQTHREWLQNGVTILKRKMDFYVNYTILELEMGLKNHLGQHFLYRWGQ